MVDFKKTGSASFIQKRKKELEANSVELGIDDYEGPLHGKETGKPEEAKTENRSSRKKGGEEVEKKKTFIRKTVAIEEDVFMQLQLLKAYHRMDHQDIIAVAVREFLKTHTDHGHIKDSSLQRIQKMVDELRKQ